MARLSDFPAKPASPEKVKRLQQQGCVFTLPPEQARRLAERQRQKREAEQTKDDKPPK